MGLPNGPRLYLCPECGNSYRDAGHLECRSAVLEPNTPSSVTVHCHVCDAKPTVARKPCLHATCKGNVIDPEWDQCLTCGLSQ
jgi:hypothetical protein